MTASANTFPVNYPQQGFRPSIQSQEDLAEAVLTGRIFAQLFLQGEPSVSYSPEQVEKVHELLFQEVYDGCGTVAGSDKEAASRKRAELALLHRQTEYLRKNTTNRADSIAGICFSHARLSQIKPFGVGNDLVASTLFCADVGRHFNIPGTRVLKQMVENPDRYQRALEFATRTNDIGPLMGIVQKSLAKADPEKEKVILSSDSFQSPFLINSEERELNNDRSSINRAFTQSLNPRFDREDGYFQREPDMAAPDITNGREAPEWKGFPLIEMLKGQPKQTPTLDEPIEPVAARKESTLKPQTNNRPVPTISVDMD